MKFQGHWCVWAAVTLSIFTSIACSTPSRDLRTARTELPSQSAAPARATEVADHAELAAGAVIVDPVVYQPAIHQSLLEHPSLWCGKPRPADPLLADAIQISSGTNSKESDLKGWEGFRVFHHIPIVMADKVSLVADETICRSAAIAFDRVIYSGRLLSEHKSLTPVIVVRLGDVWLVEEARARDLPWEVLFFDQGRKNRGASYGAGQ